MEVASKIFIFIIPILAMGLTIYFTAEEKLHVRFLKFLGVLISSMPIIGIIQGYIVKKKSPRYSQACFTQAVCCGLGFVLIKQILPIYF